MSRLAFGLVMLACISLAIIPVVADNYTLGIFGNANMDDTIDEEDIEYVRGIIDSTNEATELADANYDGTIDEDDIKQIELIIAGEERELTIIDSVGNIVTIDLPLERIIPTKTALEAMRSLKIDKNRIVAVCKYTKEDTDLYPEFAELPSVGSMYTPDYEAMLEAKPDAVVLYEGSTDARSTITSIDSNIDVMQFAFSQPDKMQEEVAKLGYLLEERDNSEDFLEFWDGSVGQIEEMTRALSEGERPRVYYEYYPDYTSVGANSGHYQKLMLAGGHNIFSELSFDAVVDLEEIIMRDPEVIVKIVGYGEYAFEGYQQENTDTSMFKAAREAIMNRPGWENITAVKNENVYIIHLDIMGGPGQLVGICYLAKWLHPDLFEDLDPQAIHQEYLTRFQGLDYNLEEQGVFVYPPLEVS